MKRLRNRLFFHFTLQYILLAAGLIILFIFLMLLLVLWLTKDEMKYNYYDTKIETIAIDTGSSVTTLEMMEGWDKDFVKDGIWVQILNHNGKVIESSNVPEGIPTQYNEQQIFEMKETKQLQGYSIHFYLETMLEEPYLFVLGVEDKARAFLQEVVDDYAGQPFSTSVITELEKKVHSLEGSLLVLSKDNRSLLTVGETVENEKPLDIYIRDLTPDIYEKKVNTFKEPETGNLWILYTPNENKEDINMNSVLGVIIAFAVSAAILLLLTIGLSIWNSFRYGKPLFIFTSWLSRMGNGQYEEVLTEKEKKQIFKKNGKVRMKYRLYSEVFQAFYTMAEKLDASTKERKRLEKTREEWMTGISHDLRTPLTTMQGYGTMLDRGQYDWSPQELKEIGKTIGEKSSYMLSLIEDFSLTFQLKNSSSQVYFQQTDVNELVETILRKYRRDRIIVHDHLRFEPISEKVFLPIAKLWFERLLDNLIYNAINHNPEGTTILIKLKRIENDFHMIVEDDGLGMDEETQKHLFTRYYRGTSTDERREGSGLGMSIAMGIAQLHKGTITVNSGINKGTIITVILPINNSKTD
ncbi:sensor histidine kinase [Bacillus sp. AK128]